MLKILIRACKIFRIVLVDICFNDKMFWILLLVLNIKDL